jgi:hypothetical protein
MADKRKAPETPLTAEPNRQQYSMNLRSRLPGTSTANQETIDPEINLDNSLGRGNGRGSGRGNGRGDGRGDGCGDARGNGRGNGRGSGRGDGRGAGPGDGRGAGRGAGQCENLDNQQNSVLNGTANGNRNDNSADDRTIENLSINENESFSVSRMLSFASNGQFPQKTITFGNKKKLYTPVLHFFKHKSHFDIKPEKNIKIKFECKDEKCILHESFGDFGNLNKHLKLHDRTNKWYGLYQNKKSSDDSSDTSTISKAKLLLVKFFITSNLAYEQLKNSYLRQCLKDELKMPCVKTFKTTYLDEVFKKMIVKIEEKCKEASYITLIPDNWSDGLNTHFLGID